MVRIGAQIAVSKKVILLSEMDPAFVRSLLLRPVANIQNAIDLAIADLPALERVGIFPYAPSTIPVLNPSEIVPG